MKLIYTNRGILTEERLREMIECGEQMEECGEVGSLDDMEPIRMRQGYHEMPLEPEMGAPAKVIVVRRLEEAGAEGSPAHSGNQGVAEVGPQGTAGSAASGNPGGANVVAEAFNRRAEALLEAWMEEEVEEELHGRQHELDLDDDGEIEASDLAMLRRGLRDKHVGKDRKRG